MKDLENRNSVSSRIQKRETLFQAPEVFANCWKDPRRGKGKRGGLRVIYYCFLSDEEIWLLTLYDKNEAVDLTKDQKGHLRQAIETERAARKGRERK